MRNATPMYTAPEAKPHYLMDVLKASTELSTNEDVSTR